jgi:hypothetical protein
MVLARRSWRMARTFSVLVIQLRCFRDTHTCAPNNLGTTRRTDPRVISMRNCLVGRKLSSDPSAGIACPLTWTAIFLGGVKVNKNLIGATCFAVTLGYGVVGCSTDIVAEADEKPEAVQQQLVTASNPSYPGRETITIAPGLQIPIGPQQDGDPNFRKPDCSSEKTSCLLNLANAVVGFVTMGGSGGLKECGTDLGINTPFYGLDIVALVNDWKEVARICREQPQAECEAALQKRNIAQLEAAVGLVCDIADCTSVALPGVIQARKVCALIRTGLSVKACIENYTTCKMKEGELFGRPIIATTGSNENCTSPGYCGRTSVRIKTDGQCRTNEDIENECDSRATEWTSTEPSKKKECQQNCRRNTRCVKNKDAVCKATK